MAKISDKKVKEIEDALYTGGNLPSGVEIDFSKSPPVYREYDSGELADIERANAAEVKAAENAPTLVRPAPEAGIVPDVG